MPGGRPTKMTPTTIQKLEDAFTVGATDQEACCHADVSMSTLYDYCQKNPKFSDRKELLKNQPTMKAKLIINDSLDRNELPTAHKVIDRKEGQKVDITSGGKEIKNNFIIQPVTTSKDNE
ncbi:MAG: hypothetical protein V3T88_08440 [Nitrosomonadaceae bacterium]